MLLQTFKVFTDVILTNQFSLRAHSFVVVGFLCVCVCVCGFVGLFIYLFFEDGEKRLLVLSRTK